MSANPVEEHRTTVEVDRTVSNAVRALLGWHRLSRSGSDLLPVLGCSQDTLSRRMNNDKSWTATEVATLAAFFGVPIQDLFSGNVNPANSEVHPDVRMSREIESAGEDRFSGADIEALVAVIVPDRHVA